MRANRSTTTKGALSLLVVALGILACPVPAAAQPTAAIPSDFNGDGYADLAVGSPFEGVGDQRSAGAVNVIYGSPKGLVAAGNAQFSQDTPGIKGVARGCARRDCDDEGDEFGTVVASGDFDRDGHADLAVGVPFDTADGTLHAGAVNVIYGSAHGLRATSNQRWSFGNLPGRAHLNDRFGSALATGDLDADGYPDLAISVLQGSSGGIPQAGIVIVMHGGPTGLTGSGMDTLSRAMTGQPDVSLFGFGASIATGDLDGDGVTDLVVGAPDYHCSSSDCVTNGGELAVFAGGPGFPAARVERWTLDSPGVAGDAARDDFLGAGLNTGDFNGDGLSDVAAGAPRKKVTDCGQYCLGQGAVSVLYGAHGGLTADGSQLWHLDAPGVPGTAKPADYLGIHLAAGDFDGDGTDELVMGIPSKDVGGKESAGMIVVLRGSRAAGLTVTGAVSWAQGSPGMPGRVGFGHWFGFSLATGNLGRSAQDDLAIGVPYDRAGGVPHAGRVIVLYGRAGGLTTDRSQSWSQASELIEGRPEPYDGFGWALSD